MRPKYSFSNYSDSGLKDKATQIHNMMSVLPLFPTPPVGYAVLLVLIQSFNNAIAAALNRDKVKVTEKRNLRVQLEVSLKELAIYIMGITDDQLTMEQTGFDVTAAGSPIGIPAAPQSVKTQSAGTGSVRVDWKRVHGANNYIVEMTTGDPEDPQAVWTVAGYPTQSKLDVQNLSPLTYYWFRVKANGTAGAGLPSAPAVGLSV